MSSVVLEDRDVLKEEKGAWWGAAAGSIYEHFRTGPKEGLSSNEAQDRLRKFGENQLPEQKRVSPLKLFLSQFSSFIVWILIGATFIAGILCEWVDASAIGVIVILNAVLGFIQ